MRLKFWAGFVLLGVLMAGAGCGQKEDTVWGERQKVLLAGLLDKLGVSYASISVDTKKKNGPFMMLKSGTRIKKNGFPFYISV